ncbi:uncharacterized protein LY89DRAFT_671495 [Mollisia scopiformis]|uniref:Zn(2)-C6 fungal-type domain-containing protein n=1 Tax=Mollisia scopiformis TaxID=149040 RepID=A0A194X4K0_MOLSC|nr:uncharacterized protein LY89DRAFT_671495 [Mollisia scopiformis]KUJ15108.1 hypothetical protein LY89DRAFT_671495 [Mollisia scopiformis]
MSSYPPPGNNYPPHPHSHANAHPHPNIQVPSPGGHHADPLSAHSQQHGIPLGHSPYPYDHQAAQQLQSPASYNGHSNGHGGHGHADDGQLQPRSVPAPAPASGGEGQKGNRLRKACDSCSIRKVKCDESGPPCRACSALDIPCTFERPSRRRGPPNRHAEAIKKRKLDSPGGPGSFSSPTSPNNVAETLASFSSHAVLNAESICPFSTLELLVDDFFTYIHPLCPFPHEPSFRLAFKAREDVSNPSFLALLASMIGLLVASFPRKPMLHLKNHRREHLFPNSMSLVDRCHKVAIAARGPGYLEKELSVYTAATSYFIGLAGAYTFQWKLTRLYFGETLNIARVLGTHKLEDPGILPVGALPAFFGGEQSTVETQVQKVDFIRQELGRRIFWVMFVGIGSIQQLGSSFGELLIPPPTRNAPYPPLPMEVDDDFIFDNRVDPQPDGIVSKLTGFNLNVKVYLSTSKLSTMELAYGIDEVFDWARQKRVLEECLRQCKHSLDHAPHELLLQPGSAPGEFASTAAQYFPPATEYPGLRVRMNGDQASEWQFTNPDARRQIQYEIQKANIYASLLGTRSYIVEKYCNLQEIHERKTANSGGEAQLSSPGVIAHGLDGLLPNTSVTNNSEGSETNVMQEKDSIVKDLLSVLSSISQVNMEPNGASFINKIRQIASTLIDQPQNRKGQAAINNEEYLKSFLGVLMKLERVSPGLVDNGVNGAVDEEEELRNWADLREYQMRFAQAGGFLSEL